MRVLVTGGLRVNGCWVTRDLLEMGHEPVVFDNRPDFTLLRDVSGDFEFIQGEKYLFIRLFVRLLRRCKPCLVNPVIEVFINNLVQCINVSG